MEKFDTSKTQFSPQDVTRGLKLPSRVTAELAEETGIHIGDGSMSISYCRNTPEHRYEISSGNYDMRYIQYHVIPMMQKIYGILPRIQQKENYFQTCYNSKGLVQFKHFIIGLPTGNKAKTITIPKIILNSSFVTRCIRGITETDGTLTFKKRHKDVYYYPYIRIDMASKPLIEQLEYLLKKLGIRFSTLYDYLVKSHGAFKDTMHHQIFVSGKKNVLDWEKKIGFSNPRNLDRLNFWKVNGFIPVNMLFNKNAWGEDRTRDPQMS